MKEESTRARDMHPDIDVSPAYAALSKHNVSMDVCDVEAQNLSCSQIEGFLHAVAARRCPQGFRQIQAGCDGHWHSKGEKNSSNNPHHPAEKAF